jgi:hypothetical protein
MPIHYCICVCTDQVAFAMGPFFSVLTIWCFVDIDYCHKVQSKLPLFFHKHFIIPSGYDILHMLIPTSSYVIAAYSVCGNSSKYVPRSTQVKWTLDRDFKILQCQTKTVEVTYNTSSFIYEDSVKFLKPSDIAAFSEPVGVFLQIGRRMHIHNRIMSLTFDMDMSYTRVLHIKVAYRVPHK